MPLFYKGIQSSKANKARSENMASVFGKDEEKD